MADQLPKQDISTALRRRETLWPRAGGLPTKALTLRPDDPTVKTIENGRRPKEASKLRKTVDTKQDEVNTTQPALTNIPSIPYSLESRPSDSEPIKRPSGSVPKTSSASSHLQNPFSVPSTNALLHSISVAPKSVWELYEWVEYCSNQGSASQGRPVLARARNNRSGVEFVVVKRHLRSMSSTLASFTKPVCDHIVTLYGAFACGPHLWMVYEEMDLSLKQIFELDCDPWTVNPGEKDDQIAAISRQVLQAIQYIHISLRLTHGGVEAGNVLLKRNGQVKLANIGTCILRTDALSPTVDVKAFALLLVQLFLPLDPRPENLEQNLIPIAWEFYQVVNQGHVGPALDHQYVATARPSSLTKLAVRTSRTFFVPPFPVELGSDGQPK